VSFPARAVFVLLVAATFAAFFVAQRLKTTPLVAVITKSTRHFSPDGDGRRDVARAKVRVRVTDDVSVNVVDAAGAVVRRLVSGQPAGKGRPVRVRWDGRDQQGRRVPDAEYFLRVSLRRGGRAATLEPPLRVDTVAPRPTVLVGGPDGSRWITGPVAGRVPFRVRVVSQRAPTVVRVRRTDLEAPRDVAVVRLPPGERDGEWDGRAGGAPAPPGVYQVVAAVRDQARNVGLSAPAVPGSGQVRGAPGVSVRALLAQPPADPVRIGEDVEVAVDSRGRPYRWRVRRVGEAKPRQQGRKRSGGRLGFPAPRGRDGLYVLELRSGRHVTTVPFTVQDARPAPLLVVVPALTWFGADRLDDDRDGFPNTLAAGGPAAYPRLLAGGLPEGFTDQTAALLAFLDRHDIRYDITTDLTLSAARSGLSGERQGVLLAGPLRWVSNDLARRLRGYVTGGGRLAAFGADTLRRGVGVGRTRLVRPLPPTDTDPFGTRLRPVRGLGATPDPLVPVADEGPTGLFTGVEELRGFGAVEESAGSERVRAALAAFDAEAQDAAEAAGEPLPEPLPVLALSDVGKGVVIRVGLPAWGARLRAGAVRVAQLTRNVADLLRGRKPQIRSF
jgi:hypothetical protein